MGIIKAANVNSKHMGGDVNGALADSASAGKWTKIGFFSGIAVYVIYGLMMVLGIGGAIMSGNH